MRQASAFKQQWNGNGDGVAIAATTSESESGDSREHAEDGPNNANGWSGNGRYDGAGNGHGYGYGYGRGVGRGGRNFTQPSRGGSSRTNGRRNFTSLAHDDDGGGTPHPSLSMSSTTHPPSLGSSSSPSSSSHLTHSRSHPLSRTHPINANPHHTPPDKNKLDIGAIERGADTRTTVMIKNIPNKMSDGDLLAWMGARGAWEEEEEVEEGCSDGDVDCFGSEIMVDVEGEREREGAFAGEGRRGARNHRRRRRMTIDFFYLRMDFGNGCNVGYAFVNFISVQDLLAFARRNLGVRW